MAMAAITSQASSDDVYASDVQTTFTSPPIIFHGRGRLLSDKYEEAVTTGLDIVGGGRPTSSSSTVLGEGLRKKDWEILLLFCVCHVCIGYSMGSLSPAMELVTNHFNLTDKWRGVLGASALAGNILGSPMGGWMADIFGRRVCMLAAWLVFVASSTCQGIAPNMWTLIGARAALGWSVGAHYAGTTAYLSETLPAARCGQLLALVETHFFIGNFVSLVLGTTFRNTFGNSPNIQWRLTLSVCSIPVALGIIWFAIRAPETKAWLEAGKAEASDDLEGGVLEINGRETETAGRETETAGRETETAGLETETAGRETETAGRETETAGRETETAGPQADTIWKSILFVSIFWASSILPTYAVSAFALKIIGDLDLSMDSFVLNMWLGASAAVGVVLGIWLIDAIGRKRLLLLSQWGVGVTFICLAMSRWMIISVCSFLAFELLNGAGAPLAMVYPAEIFPPSIKGMASGISAMNSRILAVIGIIIMSYSLGQAGIMPTLIGLGIMSATGAIVTHILAPKTTR